jgi:AGZA family xanthine/uracil permease-like MFS transporter
VLTFFGLMHGEAIGIAQSPVVAASYLAISFVLLALAKLATVSPLVIDEHEEEHHGLPVPAE